MKIGLIGYGQMGKSIEAVAVDRGHLVVFRIDEDNRDNLTDELLKSADAVIEFTGPESAFGNIIAVLDSGIPLVSGSTGWFDRFEEAAEYCRTKKGSFFYSSNFSLGVTLFFEINRRLASLMAPYPNYIPRIEEIHHTKKKDSPSGTALTLAKGIIGSNPTFIKWTPEIIAGINEIAITSIREGEVTGTHEIRYVSTEDCISIKHEAFTRKGFALGAVLAAEFLPGREGVYSMNDLIGL